MDNERWYTVEELAERWQLNTETIRRMIRRGELEAMVLPRKAGYRVVAAEVARFERERTQERRDG